MKLRFEATVNIGRFENVRIAAEDDSDHYVDGYNQEPILACRTALRGAVAGFLRELGDMGEDPGVKAQIDSYLFRVMGVGKPPEPAEVHSPMPPEAAPAAQEPPKQPPTIQPPHDGPVQPITAQPAPPRAEPAPKEEPTGVNCTECGKEIMDPGALRASELLLGKPHCRQCYKKKVGGKKP